MNNTSTTLTKSNTLIIPENRVDSINTISDFLNFLNRDRHLLVAIYPDKKSTIGKIFTETAEAEEWVTEKNKEGYNLYWTVNPINDKYIKDKKCGKKDIAYCEYMFLDLDPKDLIERDNISFNQAREEVVKTAEALKDIATFIIDSGNGVGVFIKIEDGEQLDPLKEVERLNKDYEKRYVGDHTANIDRVMRLPFTTNYSNSKKKADGYPDTSVSSMLYVNTHNVITNEDFKEELNNIIEDDEVITNTELKETMNSIKSSKTVEQVIDQMKSDDMWEKNSPDDETTVSDSECDYGALCTIIKYCDYDVDLTFDVFTHTKYYERATNGKKRNTKEKYDNGYLKRRTIPKVFKNTYTEFKELEVENSNLIEEFKEYKVVLIGGKLTIVTLKDTPRIKKSKLVITKELIITSATALRQYFTGERLKRFNEWYKLENRPTYDGIYFNPEDSIKVDNYVNLWHGFSCEPSEGDISPFMHLLEEVICDGNKDQIEYLKGYIAHQFQRPSDKPGVAIVLKQDKGTGKDTFINAIGDLYNDAFLVLANKNQVIGNFNSHLANIMMVSAAEQVFAGSHEEDSSLKNLITSESIAIEKKGYDIVNTDSYLRVYMSSNADWVVPATGSERRYFLPTMNDSVKQNKQYFTSFINWYQNGGKEALLYWALNYDISNFDVRTYPETEASIEQKIHSMDILDSVMYKALKYDNFNYIDPFDKDELDEVDALCTDIFFTSEQVADLYNRESKYKLNSKSIGMKLSNAFGKAKRHTIDGKQQRGWFMSLDEARERLCKKVGVQTLFD